MLTGLHLLLTYRCTHECDHCFLSCGPRAKGTFTLAGIRRVLNEAVKIGTIDTIYFEGGEPFLYHALLVAGVREASGRGFETGVVTNAYWAESVEDAKIALAPLAEAGLGRLTVSSDRFHGGEDVLRLAANALAAAGARGIGAGEIRTPHPEEGEGVRFRGRAAEMLTTGLPVRALSDLTECPDEDLASPGRVHLDPFGNVHLCQGLLMAGNFLEDPLSGLVRDHRAQNHPICDPIIAGGPAGLARAFGVSPERPPVSECHLCYQVRRALRDRYPDLLGPPGVYGLGW